MNAEIKVLATVADVDVSAEHYATVVGATAPHDDREAIPVAHVNVQASLAVRVNGGSPVAVDKDMHGLTGVVVDAHVGFHRFGFRGGNAQGHGDYGTGGQNTEGLRSDHGIHRTAPIGSGNECWKVGGV